MKICQANFDFAFLVNVCYNDPFDNNERDDSEHRFLRKIELREELFSQDLMPDLWIGHSEQKNSRYYS